MYYFISSKQAHTPLGVFETLDVDSDGSLNRKEMKYACKLYYAWDCDKMIVEKLAGQVLKSSEEGERRLKKGNLFPVDLESWSRSEVSLKLVEVMEKKRRYWLVDGNPSVKMFVMVDNDSSLKQQLDMIRQFKSKFICLNDDRNHDSSSSKNISDLVTQFYLSLFPRPSSFEICGK